jgi:hypothetical protein
MKTERKSNAPLVAGTLLVAFGLLALLGQVFRDVVNWSYIWPLVIIVIGSLFFAGMFLGGRQVSGLAIPGSIIGGIGLLLLYQNLTGHWESWAYAWSLIVVFVGLGIFLSGLYGADEGQKRAGLKVAQIGLILFVIFGAFFEMIFSADGGPGIRSLLFPVVLILLGLYLVVRRLGLFGQRNDEPIQPPTPPQPPVDSQ